MEFFAAGLVVGILVCLLLALRVKVGVLRFAIDDPNEPPYLFLELHKHTADITRMKYVLMQVDPETRRSQK